MKYVPPGQPGSIVSVQPRYENFIGGKWLAPTHGKYRVDLAPATAGPITEVAGSTPEDVELALDAAHAVKDAGGEASATERAEVLNAIADAVEQNMDMLAVAESWENGKPVRETLAADGAERRQQDAGVPGGDLRFPGQEDPLDRQAGQVREQDAENLKIARPA